MGILMVSPTISRTLGKSPASSPMMSPLATTMSTLKRLNITAAFLMLRLVSASASLMAPSTPILRGPSHGPPSSSMVLPLIFHVLPAASTVMGAGRSKNGPGHFDPYISTTSAQLCGVVGSGSSSTTSSLGGGGGGFGG